MKKFFVPLFFALLFSCSTEDFKSEIAASAQKDVDCWVIIENECKFRQISKSLCDEIGIPKSECPAEVSSSSEEEISSSSRNAASSSSRNAGSSSSRAGSSSSGGSVVSSSSDDEEVSSSSGGGAVSSSSVVNLSSSSGGGVSSSSVVVVSSSSSEPPAEPTWSECNIPQYVGRNEPIANLKFISIVNNNGCVITYKLGSSNSNATNLNYGSSAVGTNQTLNITASATCTGGITLSPNPKSCSKTVTVADYVKIIEMRESAILKSGRTVVDILEAPAAATMFGCQARDPSGSENTFQGKTSFILDGDTASVTDNEWWVKIPITNGRMLFESNNQGVGTYRCQIE